MEHGQHLSQRVFGKLLPVGSALEARDLLAHEIRKVRIGSFLGRHLRLRPGNLGLQDAPHFL